MSQEEHAMAGLEDEDLEAQLAELEQVVLVHTACCAEGVVGTSSTL